MGWTSTSVNSVGASSTWWLLLHGLRRAMSNKFPASQGTCWAAIISGLSPYQFPKKYPVDHFLQSLGGPSSGMSLNYLTIGWCNNSQTLHGTAIYAYIDSSNHPNGVAYAYMAVVAVASRPLLGTQGDQGRTLEFRPDPWDRPSRPHRDANVAPTGGVLLVSISQGRRRN